MANPIRDALKGLHQKIRGTVRDGVRRGAEGFSAQGLGEAGSKIEGQVAKHLETHADKMIGRVVKEEFERATRPNFFKRAGKKAGIAALVIGGVAAIGVAASNMRKRRSKLPERDNSDLDAIAASIPDTLPAGPADGRAPDEWQSRVRPGAQPARGPVNPAMNVGPDAQDLGAPPSRA